MHRNDRYYTSEDAAVAAHQNIKERDYWLGQLAGELEKTCFPYDFKGAENRARRRETLTFKCSPELAAGLLKLSNQSDVRLHMILLTGMVGLLYRYTGHHDILVGTPVLKQAVEAEFINTVLTLRSQVNPEMSFKELLIRLRRTLTEATENQNYPLETLLYKLDIPRQADDFPLFDVAVLLESIHTKSYLDHIPVNMTWSFRQRGRELDGTLEYNGHLFRRASVERFTGHYLNLLQEALRQIQLPLPQINILSPPERAQILCEFNNRRQEYEEDESVCAAVAKQSEASPHRVALVLADRAVTYGELNKRANRLAHFLNRRGMTANSPAVLLCRRSPDMAAAVLAVWKAGGAYIPLDVDYPRDRVRLVLADAAAHFLLTESAVVGDEEKSHLKTGEILDICADAGVRQVVFLDRFEGAARGCRLFRVFRLSRLLGSGTVPLYDEWKQPVAFLRRFISHLPVEPGTGVGVILEQPLYFMISVLALKAQALPFTFIDPALPLAEQRRLLKERSISTVISRSPFLDQLDQLLWESKVFRRYVLLDDYDPCRSKKETFIRDLFDFVAQEEPVAEINEYGWRNSYNYENFSLPEMREYIDNLKAKVGPYLKRDSRVLEVGCGHGIMLFELAPSVGFYLATDLAPLIMDINKGKLRQRGLNRVVLKTAAASEIDTLGEGDFDVVICSSVIQFFPNTLYLEDMIKKAIGLLKRRGVIYLDDIMDLRKKQQLVQSILDYRRLHPGARVKTNWDNELFIDIDFFHDLQQKYPQIVEWQGSGKLGKIENELTRFRFDVMLKIDKDIPAARGAPACFKNRYTAGDIAAYVQAPFRLPEAGSPIPAVGDVDDITAFEAGPDRSPVPGPRPSDPCYAIYTSGSTGKPKGAVVEHRGMKNHIRAKIRDLSIDADSVVAQNASQTFDISVWQFFASLTVGGKVVIYSPEMILDPTALTRRLMADGVTILEVVPSYLTVLLDCLDEGEDRLDTLTYLLVTGETLKPGLVERWFARFPGIKMVNAYGPTEAADDITHQVLTGPVDTVSVPIGTALPNLNVYIVDRHHHLNPIGVRGEICVSGVGVGRGYLNNPEATNRVFGRDPFDPDREQRFYRTGDLGRFAADGTIEFLGRQDEQVKIRGFRIELAEIENRLTRHGQVKEAVVVTGSDEQGEPHLCAYLTADGVLDVREIRAYLEGKLPDYMVPSYFVQLAAIPLNKNGKIDRRALSRQQPGKRAAAALDPARVSALFTFLRQQDVLTGQPPLSVAGIFPEEQEKYLADGHSQLADEPGEKTLGERLRERVAATPHQTALVFENEMGAASHRLTFRQLDERADQLAAVLRRRGIKAGDTVGLWCGRLPDWIAALLAILKVGATYLFLAPELPPHQVTAELKDNRAVMLLTDTEGVRKSSFVALQGLLSGRDKPCLTAPRPQITDLDRLPLPLRSLVDYDAYSQHIGQAMVKHCVSLQASRGCPYNCLYCHKIWPKNHVVRSAENIYAEVKLHYDIFNLDQKNSVRFFDLLCKNRLKVQLFFPNGLRGDILTEAYIDRMVEAGTTGLALALETASPRLQKLIGKHLHIERLRQNMAYICRQHPQVILELFTMHGLPGESEQEALMTMAFLKELKWVHFPYIEILKIYPNTDMAQLALEYGISREAIERSVSLAFHQIPDTLPFERHFTLKYQTDYLNDYFLCRERLLHVLPYQMKVLSEDEFVQKYDSYLAVDIKSFDDLLKFAGIRREELGPQEFLDEGHFAVPRLSEKMKACFPPAEPVEGCLRVLLLDLSQFFSWENRDMLYDVVEPPLGLMYLLTYLEREFGAGVHGRLAKSRLDFDSYDELAALLEAFKPHIIGIRTLTFFRDFFHQTVEMIRLWGIDVPIIAGGPYATSDYAAILQDRNIDLVVIGEGEVTFARLVEEILKNDKKLPPQEVLQQIEGLAFLPGGRRDSSRKSLEVVVLDALGAAALNSGKEPVPDSAVSTLSHRQLGRRLDDDLERFYRSSHLPAGAPLLASYLFEPSAEQVVAAFLRGGSLYVVPPSRRPGDITFLESYAQPGSDAGGSRPIHVRLGLKPGGEPVGEAAGGRAFVPPGGELEQKLAEIWSEVLRVDKNSISVDANFFEYGGHSLKAVILTSRLHKMLHVKVPLAEIFKTPTIRGLARYVAAAGHEDHASLRCAEEKAFYPLSSSQKRLYILQQIDSALVNYNIPVMVTLEGGLERQKLEAAFAGLIRRHESFRTSFRVVGLEPVQIIHEAVDFEIEYYGAGAGEPQDIVRAFVRPFDLAQAPLLRVGLIEAGEKYVLAVDMHHVVSDGISMGIFIKEAMALYSGAELPGLAYRYRDFSEWQNRTAETSAIKRQQAYWLAQFAGTIPLLKLPTDYPRPAVQSHEGGCVTVEIGEAETRGLKALAVEQDASLYMVLLALFNVLFSKLSRQADIVIGTPVAGRRHSDLEHIIGMFINTLALRNYPRGEQLFREFLGQVRQRTLEAFENQDYQFEDLVNALSLERDAGRNPLFDVLFVFQNIDVLPGTIPEVRLPGLRLTPFAYNSTISRYDLGFAGQERQGRLILSCEYCTKLFKPGTVQRFMDYFKEITQAVLAENEILLQDIRISHDLYDRELNIPRIDFDF